MRFYHIVPLEFAVFPIAQKSHYTEMFAKKALSAQWDVLKSYTYKDQQGQSINLSTFILFTFSTQTLKQIVQLISNLGQSVMTLYST